MNDQFDKKIKETLEGYELPYDAAAWSAVSALSEMSVARGGELVDFPDFTRGQWIKRHPSFAMDVQYPIDPERDYINNLF